MHSSRMRTVRCSSRRGGGWGWGCVSQHALGRTVCVCIPACTGQRGCVSQHALDRGCLPEGGRCKNITFPQLRLRTVKNRVRKRGRGWVAHQALANGYLLIQLPKITSRSVRFSCSRQHNLSFKQL